MKLLFILFLMMAASVRADDRFRAYLSSTNLIEGGRVETMVVLTDRQQSTLQTPKGWSHQVSESQKRITFQSVSGKSALTIQFTTNSPGVLPSESKLKTLVMAEHPGSGLLQSSRCPTSSGPGVFFDLVRMPAPQVIFKVRHAFVAGPAGDAEFALSCSDDEFDQQKLALMRMLLSFRAIPVKSK